MYDTTVGNCETDNQGQPIPSIGGTCNLASMHLDSSAIETPEPLMNDLQASGLDWEFYDLDPRASAGANPRSQNDLYGNMYSLSSFFSDDAHSSVNEPMLREDLRDVIAQQKSVPAPCGCNGNVHKEHAPKSLISDMLLKYGLMILVGFYILKQIK